MAEALRPMGLGRGLERSQERGLAPEGDLHVGPPGELEHRAGVDPDLARVDVARDARDGDEVHLRRGHRVQEGKAVIDPGVDIEDEALPFGHPSMLPEPRARYGAEVFDWGRLASPTNPRFRLGHERARSSPQDAVSAPGRGAIFGTANPELRWRRMSRG